MPWAFYQMPSFLTENNMLLLFMKLPDLVQSYLVVHSITDRPTSDSLHLCTVFANVNSLPGMLFYSLVK